MNRRKFLALAGTAAALSGCGLLGNKSSGAGDEKAINFYHWRAEDKQVFDQLIKQFKAANPGYDVTMTILPSQNYQSTALQKIKDGTAGDVFTAFRGAQFEQIAKAGVFTDLSEASFVADYQPHLIEPGAKDGKQLGLPYQLVFNMPVYNVELFEKAGVVEGELPKDWKGFLALCEKLKGIGVAPIAFPGGDAANAGQLFNCMVMNEMPEADSCRKIEEGKAKVTDDWFLRARYEDLVAMGAFQEGSAGTKTEQAIQMWAQAKAAMLATGTFHIGAARQQGATFRVNLIGPITTDAGKATYEGVYNSTFILGVNAKSAKQEAARKWVEFLSGKPAAETYANGTVQHLTVKDLTYTNADLAATAGWVTRKTLLAPRFQFDDLDIRNAVENACTQVATGTAKPAQAAEEAQKIISQRLGTS
jgi:raffinose/stachyose/melibiose transport system substrate-binding protein